MTSEILGTKRIFEFWRRGRQGGPEKVLTMIVEGGEYRLEGGSEEIRKNLIDDLERPQALLFDHIFDPRDPMHLDRLPEIFSGSYFWAAEMLLDDQGQNTGKIHPRHRKKD